MTAFDSGNFSPRDSSASEARFDLAAAAARTEMRNRPRSLVLLAGLVLVVCAAVAAWAVAQERSAQSKLTQNRAWSVNLVNKAAELKKLRAEFDAKGSSGGFVPNTMIRSTINSYARQAGMKAEPQAPRVTAEAPIGEVQRTIIDYSKVKDESIGAILAWVELSLRSVPGLEVEGIKIMPEAHEWSADIKFYRWERLDR